MWSPYVGCVRVYRVQQLQGAMPCRKNRLIVICRGMRELYYAARVKMAETLNC